jgi:hypothetical protein
MNWIAKFPLDAIRDNELAAHKAEHRAFAMLLRDRTGGKTCGECEHYAGNVCDRRKNLNGGPMMIFTPGAIACADWANK